VAEHVVAAPAPAPVLLRRDLGRIATLTLNRPAQFNALSEELLSALQRELDALSEAREIRVVVLAASGRAFCAGHDLREMRSRPDESYYRELFARCAHMMQSILQLPQPVIAQVQGVATAAGCQLVASCDLAVAARDARFATSGINLGLFCATPAVAVSRNLSRKDAFQMLFGGEFLAAATARELGLVNQVVEPEQLESEVMGLAETLAAKPRAALQLGKELFYRQLAQPLPDAYALAGQVMAANMMDPDAVEGIDAFLEKRDPSWKQVPKG
jgi:enoyl-CoA hydratase/carnithine racemase